MTDREKVIKELHDARRYLEDKEWSDRGASPHIDAINDALDMLKEQEDLGTELTNAVELIHKKNERIEKLLKEQEAYGWKLCSDELPENDDEVLVTYIVNGNQKKRYVETASYFDHEEIDGHWNSVWDEYRVRGTKTEVVAWMPMPKPYKEGR